MKRIPGNDARQGQNELHSKLSSDFEIEDLTKNLLKLTNFLFELILTTLNSEMAKFFFYNFKKSRSFTVYKKEEKFSNSFGQSKFFA